MEKQHEDPEWQQLLEVVDRLEAEGHVDGMMAATAREFVHKRSDALLLTWRTYRNSKQLAQKISETCRERLCEFSFTASPLKTP